MSTFQEARRSLRENWKGMALMMVAAGFVAVGQLLWKLSHGRDILLLGLGFVAYGFGSLMMVLAFRFGRLSVVHPVLSLSYVLGIALGYAFLSECLRAVQLAAVAMILVGVVLIGGGDHG